MFTSLAASCSANDVEPVDSATAQIALRNAAQSMLSNGFEVKYRTPDAIVQVQYVAPTSMKQVYDPFKTGSSEATTIIVSDGSAWSNATGDPQFRRVRQSYDLLNDAKEPLVSLEAASVATATASKISLTFGPGSQYESGTAVVSGGRIEKLELVQRNESKQVYDYKILPDAFVVEIPSAFQTPDGPYETWCDEGGRSSDPTSLLCS